MRTQRPTLCRVLPLVAVLLAAAPVLAQGPGKKEIADNIAKTYGVTVLRTVEGESDGKPVLYVTVMNPGGNSDSAFQVTTLEVDPATGALVSQFRTTPTGQVDTGPGPREPSDESGPVMRQWSTRDARR